MVHTLDPTALAFVIDAALGGGRHGSTLHPRPSNPAKVQLAKTQIHEPWQERAEGLDSYPCL